MNRILKRIFSQRVWQYRDLDVYYRLELDGGGTEMAKHFVEFVRKMFPDQGGPRFKYVFEWCSGPGFIGYALLAEGICERLCLADINPEAIACAKRTAVENGLSKKVDLFVSDNFKHIPTNLNFDLIVSNPPSYYALNPKHPYYERFKDDLRPNDRGWSIHKEFYATAASRLQAGGIMLIHEINPHEAEVWTPGFNVPYDIRPRPAIDDFRHMISIGGLQFEGTFPLCTTPGGFHSEIIRSRKA